MDKYVLFTPLIRVEQQVFVHYRQKREDVTIPLEKVFVCPVHLRGLRVGSEQKVCLKGQDQKSQNRRGRKMWRIESHLLSKKPISHEVNGFKICSLVFGLLREERQRQATRRRSPAVGT